MARSLNRAQLIGNLTRDPELRYTPAGTAVCSFSIATNRNWTTDTGEKREEVEFHRIVAWAKLAELCSQFLVKGRKVYVEGRLATRSWTATDGTNKSTTEIVIDDMILLDSKRPENATGATDQSVANQPAAESPAKPAKKTSVVSISEKESAKEMPAKKEKKEEEVAPDDIPF